MTGHDSIGWRRHSRVRTVPPERSMERDVHEHTDLGPDGLAALASVHALCAWRLFSLFGLSILRNPWLGESELRMVGGDAVTTAEGDGRARGIRTWKYARCSPSLSSVAIDEEIGNAELQPQCQSACRAVYNMMAGLFWRPASLPWSHVGLPSAAAAVVFFCSLLCDQQQRQSLHRGTTGCAAAVVRPSFVPRLVTEAGRRAGRRCRPPTQLPVAYASAM